MSEFYVRSQLIGSTPVLVPEDEAAGEIMARLARGVPLKSSVVQPRDGGNHRYFFALVRRVWENLPDHIHMTEEDLREHLLIRAGYYRVYTDPSGNTHVRAKSIAWAKLDETAFNALKDAIIKVIVTEIIPGFDNENSELAVLDMLG